MKKSIVSDGRNRYLRLIPEAETADGYELKMLTRTQPDQLLKIHPGSEGGSVTFDYVITDLVALETASEEARTVLHAVVLGLESLAEVLRQHLLDPDGLVLSPDTVFLQRETGRIFFCYAPGNRKPLQESLTELMEFFIKYVNPTGEAEVLLVYGLYRKSREENVTLQSLASFWREQTKGRPALTERPASARGPQQDRKERAVYEELGLDPYDTGAAAYYGEPAAPENPGSGQKPSAARTDRPDEKPSLWKQLFDRKKEKDAPEAPEGRKSITAKMKDHLLPILVTVIIAVGVVLFLVI